MKTTMTENGRLRVPAPPQQRISKSRVATIKAAALVAAIALNLYDAWVSWQGLKMLSLPDFAPLVLALLILIVQLASGAIQQLGMNPFRGVGGNKLMDFLWVWGLVSVYVVDVGSNALAFGISQYLSLAAILAAPINTLGMGAIVLMLAVLLCFGDEILLRLVDRLAIGARANDAAARKAAIDALAYQRYLTGYKQRALANADRAGQSATVDFAWLQQGGIDGDA